MDQQYLQWIQQLIMSMLQQGGGVPGFTATTQGNPAFYPGMAGQLPGGSAAVGSSGFFPGGTGLTPTTQVAPPAFDPPYPGMPLPPLPPGAPAGQPSSPVQQAQGIAGQGGAPAGAMGAAMPEFSHEGPD